MIVIHSEVEGIESLTGCNSIRRIGKSICGQTEGSSLWKQLGSFYSEEESRKTMEYIALAIKNGDKYFSIKGVK